jgi:N-acetylmuramoyl-L-alanine amidase
MKNITVFIDAGHGGMINGKYQTAPAKMFDHGYGQMFYEGVSNRQFADDLKWELKQRGIPYIDVTATELDVPLSARVDIINDLYKKYPNGILLSLHSNAGGGTGFEVWTSVGQTRSDQFAEELSEELMRSFPDIKFRKDSQDGDLDKESQFYILKNTNCPAVLPECLFYDNYEDYKLLTNITFRRDYVYALVRWIERCEKIGI